MKIPQVRVSLVRERTLAYRPRLQESCSAAAVLHALLDDADREKLVVIHVNGLNDLTGVEMVAIGSMHNCPVIAKDVFRGAIVGGAAAIILGHNHLSSVPAPSPQDIEVTRALRKVGKLLGVEVLDHVIVSANGQHVSMLDLDVFEEEDVN